MLHGLVEERTFTCYSGEEVFSPWAQRGFKSYSPRSNNPNIKKSLPPPRIDTQLCNREVTGDSGSPTGVFCVDLCLSEASPENAARERTRVRTLRQAFLALQAALPAVPPDTKLSKLDVLVLATSYIAHLTRTLGHELPGPAWPPFLRGLRYLHPLKKWPMRSRLYAGGLGCSSLDSTPATAASQRTRDEEVGAQVSVATDILLLSDPVSPSPGPWCTVKPTAQLHFTLLNKSYINHDEEDFSLTFPPGIPHEEVVLEETQWPTSELKLADGRLLDLLNQTNGLYSVHLTVDGSGNHMISLGDADKKSCKGFFGWYSCLLSSSNKGNIAATFFLTIMSVGFIVALIVSVYLCYRCCLALIAHPKEVHCHQVVVLHSGDPPSTKIYRGHLVQSTPESILLLSLPTHIAHVISREQPERSSPPSPNSS
ncbi:transcription factor 23 [Cricetulus griseus]